MKPSNSKTPRPKSRPFKKFYCDRPNIFLVPAPALKIWLYHYAREGNERQSWPSIETMCKALAMGEDTVYKWRKWLLENRWLIKEGERGDDGLFKIPIIRVSNGVIPNSNGSGSDGRKKRTEAESIGYGNRLRKYRVRPSPKVSASVDPKVSAMDRPDSIGVEVDSKKQVDSKEEVKPQKQVDGPDSLKGPDSNSPGSPRPLSVVEKIRQEVEQKRRGDVCQAI